MLWECKQSSKNHKYNVHIKNSYSEFSIWGISIRTESTTYYLSKHQLERRRQLARRAHNSLVNVPSNTSTPLDLLNKNLQAEEWFRQA